MYDFRDSGGQAVDYPLHAEVRLLELVSDCSKECLKVGGVIDDCCQGYLKPPGHVRIDCGSKNDKIFI